MGQVGDTVERRLVLGTLIGCVTYRSAIEWLQAAAKREKPSAVCAANTHIVSLARHDPSFGAVMRQFDLILPDGMPLVWTLNAGGAGLSDRVYGPYFMREALCQLGPPWKHFFFGGRRETLDRLVEQARSFAPRVQIAGTFSPPFRHWNEEEEREFAQIIERSGADFIWVALGGERQERWIVRNLPRYRRGVFLAVGDAFELLAGNRPFAPGWMQRLSLTWLYRLLQEPGRLWPRYLKFNSLFLYYSVRDRIWPRFRSQVPGAAPSRSVLFIGSRGVPARYSGFEKAVQEIGARLVERGYEVTVFNRPQFYPDRPTEFRGMKLVYLPTVPSKSLETIVHTLLSLLNAWFRREDIIYLCGVGNAPLAFLGQLVGRKVLINVDGADYQRRKWGKLARWWLQFSEQWAVFCQYQLVADNEEIVARYRRDYHFEPSFIPYGVDPVTEPVSVGACEKFGLKPQGYILFVSRLTPENDAEILLEAHRRMKRRFPLVLVGDAGYETGYLQSLRKMASPEVTFTGGIYGPGYTEISQQALCFVLPSAIEATRLVLLDQMAFGSAVVFRDVPATRRVIGDAGIGFSGPDLPSALAVVLDDLVTNPQRCVELGRKAQDRVRQQFGWKQVMDSYERLFESL
ncbi:MAG: hypothetical protein OHK005_13810 [Candidatus Methylacidiphilales bacterium]